MPTEPDHAPETLRRPADGVPRLAPLRPVVLVCGKCLKRCDSGKAMRRALKQGARALAAERAGREGEGRGKGRGKARIVETGCLGLCPRGALVAASAATLARGEALLLRDEKEAVAALPRLLP